MAAARLFALTVLGLLSAPPSLADEPPVYTCDLTSSTRTTTLVMRLSSSHVAFQYAGAWSDNVCAQSKTTCSRDAQGRIRAAGQSMMTTVLGDLLFDPASGELTVTTSSPGQSTTVTGICRSVNDGLS